MEMMAERLHKIFMYGKINTIIYLDRYLARVVLNVNETYS